MAKPTFPADATTGQLYKPAMEIKTQAEADEYLEGLIDWAVTCHGQSREEAERIQKQNLGYWAGYYNAETMERVNKLFRTSHPVFGKEWPTPTQAFRMGCASGSEARRAEEAKSGG